MALWQFKTCTHLCPLIVKRSSWMWSSGSSYNQSRHTQTELVQFTLDYSFYVNITLHKIIPSVVINPLTYGLNLSWYQEISMSKTMPGSFARMWNVSQDATFTPAGLEELVLFKSPWIQGWKTINSKAGPISCWGSVRSRQQGHWVTQLTLILSQCGPVRTKYIAPICPVTPPLLSVHGFPF